MEPLAAANVLNTGIVSGKKIEIAPTDSYQVMLDKTNSSWQVRIYCLHCNIISIN